MIISAVCMACGLYYMSELAEEHTSLAKRILKHMIHFQIVAHVLLLIYERFPSLYVSLGLLTHCCYFLLLRKFPIVELSSGVFIMACVLFVVSNIGWFVLFKNNVELIDRYAVLSGPAVSAFFALMVWSVPIGLFVSLTLNDSMLPATAQRSNASKRQSIFSSVLSWISKQFNRIKSNLV